MIILGPVAVAANGVIGSNNDLPWYLPEDLKNFKRITDGKTVLMGRLTYESIFKRLGKPLPERENIVISSSANFSAPPEVKAFSSIQDALKFIEPGDVYVIGGGKIFEQMLSLAQKMIITHVKGEYAGDVYFPKVEWEEWEKIDEEPHPGFTFSEYVRKNQD